MFRLGAIFLDDLLLFWQIVCFLLKIKLLNKISKSRLQKRSLYILEHPGFFFSTVRGLT